MSVSAGVVRSRVSRQAGVSQRVHNKRPLKASPMEQAGSGSRRNHLVGPLLRRAAFQGTKGRREQDKPHGRGRHICLWHEVMSHYLHRLPASVTWEACVRACVRSLGHSHCPAPPGGTGPRSHKDSDFPPSRPEQDHTSSQSDASLTFQRGFLLRLVCL